MWDKRKDCKRQHCQHNNEVFTTMVVKRKKSRRREVKGSAQAWNK
jgi:hypothetical protein